MVEVWKNVSGYENRYMVSNFGAVYSVLTHKRLKPHTKYDGHTTVWLYKDGKAKIHGVHHLVAEAFLPNPDGLPIVHHLDDNPRNNHVSNLKWVTQKENVHYTIVTGKHGKMWGRK